MAFRHEARVARAGALLSNAIAWLLAAGAVLAAEPTASTTPGGDPRSSGQGPGLVGDPLFAIGLVALIGVVALASTLLYVRATSGPHRS